VKIHRLNPSTVTASVLAKPLTNAQGKPLRDAAGHLLFQTARMNDGGGLALLPNYKSEPEKAGGQLVPSGIHRWIFRSTINGKAFEMGLGVLAEVSASEARKMADEARRKVGRGEDPRAERQGKRAKDLQGIEDARRVRLGLPAEGSFREWTLRFIKKQTPSWGAPEKTMAAWIGSNNKPGEYSGQMGNHVFPVIGNMKIEAITRPQLAKLFESIEAPSMRCAVVKKVNQVMRFAKLSDALKENVCEDIQHILPEYDGDKNPAVKTAEALADVLAKFAVCNSGQVMKTAMMVQVYLMQRSDISASMEWAEINRGVWTVPASKMKGSAKDKKGPAHVVPLPRQVIEMLEALRPLTGAGRYVFPNAWRADDRMTATSINTAMQRAMGKKDGETWEAYQTAHGFRALGITFGQRYCGGNKCVLDLIAGHKLAGNLGDIYDRNLWEEERGPTLQTYADWLDAIQAGQPDAFLTKGERDRAAAARAEAANAPTIDPARWARFLAMEAAEAAAGAQKAA
jgi:integrase